MIVRFEDFRVSTYDNSNRITVTHSPTGLFRSCNDSRSMHANKQSALEQITKVIEDLPEVRKDLNILTASVARAKTQMAVEDIKEAAIVKINADPVYYEVFGFILAKINKSIELGRFGCSLAQNELYAIFPQCNTTHKDWFKLLIDLGYQVGSSNSSHPNNEIFFIKWTNTIIV